MNKLVKEFKLIVSGNIHYYRHYVVELARELQLQGSAENLEDGTVKILCKGEEDIIEKFVNRIKVKRPTDAPWIEEVENIEKCELEKGSIKDKSFKEIYGNMNEEMAKGFAAYDDFLLYCINDVKKSRCENDMKISNFTNEKYSKIAIQESKFDKNIEEMNNSVKERMKKIDATQKRFDEMHKLWEERMDKIDKNIEYLLNILAQNIKYEGD